jgi:TonB family protein
MLGLFASVLLAQAAASPDAVVRQPDWMRVPTGAEMAQYYPTDAKKAGVGGRAVLSCTATADGTLADCHVDEVYPAGAGFDEAALRLTPLFKLHPAINARGEAVGGGTIRIPIVFRTPGAPMDALTSAVTCYSHAAALAERDPSDADAWYGVRFWTLQAMAMAATAHDKPSGIERDLSGSRIMAASRIDTPAARAETDACIRAMKAAK